MSIFDQYGIQFLYPSQTKFFFFFFFGGGGGEGGGRPRGWGGGEGGGVEGGVVRLSVRRFIRNTGFS